MIKRARRVRESGARVLLFLLLLLLRCTKTTALQKILSAWASTAINSFVRCRFLCFIRGWERVWEWVRYVQIIKSWHEWNARAQISSSLIRMHAAFCRERVLVLAAARGCWVFVDPQPRYICGERTVYSDRTYFARRGLLLPAGVCFILLFTSAAYIQFWAHSSIFLLSVVGVRFWAFGRICLRA